MSGPVAWFDTPGGIAGHLAGRSNSSAHEGVSAGRQGPVENGDLAERDAQARAFEEAWATSLTAEGKPVLAVQRQVAAQRGGNWLTEEQTRDLIKLMTASQRVEQARRETTGPNELSSAVVAARERFALARERENNPLARTVG